MPFPILKLAYLLVKQCARPVSNVVKKMAKDNRTFQNSCIKCAEMYHSFDFNVQTKNVLGIPKKKQELYREQAVALGADIIAEGFLYLFLAGLVVTEYKISSNSSEREKEESAHQTKEVQNRLLQMEIDSDHRDAEIRELRRTVGELHSKCSK